MKVKRRIIETGSLLHTETRSSFEGEKEYLDRVFQAESHQGFDGEVVGERGIFDGYVATATTTIEGSTIKSNVFDGYVATATTKKKEE